MVLNAVWPGAPSSDALVLCTASGSLMEELGSLVVNPQMDYRVWGHCTMRGKGVSSFRLVGDHGV